MAITVQRSKLKSPAPDKSAAHLKQSHTLMWKIMIIGSLMFTMNHGAALVKGEMNFHRWFSAILGFVIPLIANVDCFCIRRSSESNPAFNAKLQECC